LLGKKGQRIMGERHRRKKVLGVSKVFIPERGARFGPRKQKGGKRKLSWKGGRSQGKARGQETDYNTKKND